jgi:tRNA-dihydrouridine synthase B
VAPPVVLAPMEGVTDRPFRLTVRELGGCGLAVTEFVSSEAMTRDVADAWRMAEVDPSEHPVSIQIYGRDPDRMAAAARSCAALGADLIDINLGCPSKRVTSGCAGSALMREPALCDEIFDAVARAVSIPFTVKMRLGWDHSDHSAPRIAALATGRGAAMVAVHGRTKSDAYRGSANWTAIRPVREAIDVPLLVNGDIVDLDTALRALEASGADGVMVGRGVMSDPWTLRRISDGLRGVPFEEPPLAARFDAIDRFFARLLETYPEGNRGLTRLKNVIGYFSKGLYGSARLRATLNAARTWEEARDTLEAFRHATLDESAHGA